MFIRVELPLSQTAAGVATIGIGSRSVTTVSIDEVERAFAAGDFARLRELAETSEDAAVKAKAAELAARTGFGRAEVAFFTACAIAFLTIAIFYYGAP